MEKKLNPYRLRIVGTEYRFNKNGKTTCRISYINPISGNRHVVLGVAKLKPGESFTDKTGKRIAESRAKREMYSNYCKFLDYFVGECHWKHMRLAEKEQEHIKKLIDDLR